MKQPEGVKRVPASGRYSEACAARTILKPIFHMLHLVHTLRHKEEKKTQSKPHNMRNFNLP